MKRTLALLFATMLLVGGAIFVWIGWKASHATNRANDTVINGDDRAVPDPVPQRPEGIDEPILERYTLTDRFGKSYRSEELEGKIHVASFFFSSCPKSCFRMNQRIKRYEDEFGDEGVMFVSITCDPGADKPERLKQYARTLKASKDRWKFLTGDLQYTRRIGAEVYRVAVDKQTHQEKLIVVGRGGDIEGYYSWKDPSGIAEMRRAINGLLKKPSVPDENKE